MSWGIVQKGRTHKIAKNWPPCPCDNFENKFWKFLYFCTKKYGRSHLKNPPLFALDKPPPPFLRTSFIGGLWKKFGTPFFYLFRLTGFIVADVKETWVKTIFDRWHPPFRNRFRRLFRPCSFKRSRHQSGLVDQMGSKSGGVCV